MTVGSSAGLVQDISVTVVPNTVTVGGSIRIGSGDAGDPEVVKVIEVFPSKKVIRVQRNTGFAHTLGSRVDVLNSQISIPVQTTKFTSEVNNIIFFNGPQSVGVGTTPGGAIEVQEFIGGNVEEVSIPTRTIRIPNHPFKNGQKLTINKRNGANRFDVGRTNLVTEFKLSLIHI